MSIQRWQALIDGEWVFVDGVRLCDWWLDPAMTYGVTLEYVDVPHDPAQLRVEMTDERSPKQPDADATETVEKPEQRREVLSGRLWPIGRMPGPAKLDADG